LRALRRARKRRQRNKNMLFKLIGNLIIATVALQLIPGTWTEAIENREANPEIIMGRLLWNQDFAQSEDLRTAFSEGNDSAPIKVREESLGVRVSAASVIVVDAASGKILYEKDSDTPRSIASLTKLMTALVFLETEPNWEEAVNVGSCGQFAYGKIKIKDIFSAALVASDNCAARELARQTGLSGNEFARAMNHRAESLGLSKTNFSDPTGLDAKNISTALEVAKILREILNWPKARNAASQFYYEFSSTAGRPYYAKSTDDLLWSFIHKYPYEIVGGKTGTLGEAGYCLALAVEKDGNEVIVVTLKNKSDYLRFHDAKSLAHWAFSVYEWPESYD